ncbi:terminase gpA endonuclease subunit, partial [Ralstonia sp.]|uniref:terminase gpA endonuclease subunit n=1 Tax=Ralstonia sp. TaxID=54061 RepID=UPI00257A0D41
VIHASGVELSVAACAIDTGGHHTQQVYAYVRAHQVLAVKGASIKGKSLLSKPTDIDVTWRGQRIPRGVKLWLVGTDIAKGLIYGRLRIDQPGPGYVHLPKELTGTDEFEQLTAERLVTRYNKGFSRMEWIKPPGRRNEALDCYVYALAAAVWAGIERFTEKQWRQLEAHAMPEQEKPEAKQAPAKQPIPQPEPQNPVEIRRQIIRTVNRSRSAPTW